MTDIHLFFAAIFTALSLISPPVGEYGPGWSISPSHTPAGVNSEHSALKGGEK